jgi:hypothetical protein
MSTTREVLVKDLDTFFELWCTLETKYNEVYVLTLYSNGSGVFHSVNHPQTVFYFENVKSLIKQTKELL